MASRTFNNIHYLGIVVNILSPCDFSCRLFFLLSSFSSFILSSPLSTLLFSLLSHSPVSFFFFSSVYSSFLFILFLFRFHLSRLSLSSHLFSRVSSPPSILSFFSFIFSFFVSYPFSSICRLLSRLRTFVISLLLAYSIHKRSCFFVL